MLDISSKSIPKHFCKEPLRSSYHASTACLEGDNCLKAPSAAQNVRPGISYYSVQSKPHRNTQCALRILLGDKYFYFSYLFGFLAYS